MPNLPQAAVFLPAQNGLPGFEKRHAEYLAAHCKGIVWRSVADSGRFLEILPEVDIALTWKFRKEWLENARRLKILSTPAAGKEWLQVRSGNGLEVIFGSFHGELMAETAVGLMLAFCRGIRQSIARQDADPWARTEIAADMRQLRGSHAAILGFGHIGKWVARLLKPFGVRITGVNRTDMTRPSFLEPEDRVVPSADLDSVLPETDHLILVLPGDSASDKIMDGRRLALLPKSSFIYNLGRGNSIDTDALATALKSGALAGAGLDVHEKEPMPADCPLRGCPNVILMPHVSAFAPNYLDLYFKELAGKLAPYFPEHVSPDGVAGG